MAKVMYPESPASSTHAVRGIDTAMSLSKPSRGRQQPRLGTMGVVENDMRHSNTCFDRDGQSFNHHDSTGTHWAQQDAYHRQDALHGSRRSSGSSSSNSNRQRTNQWPASPCSVAQALRTNKRVSRKISMPEEAEISRPGPIREDSVTSISNSSRHSKGSGAPASYIEIEPGVRARLRKSEETEQAIRRNAFVTTTCFGCETNVYCIDDAKFMICPHCRVVSPLLHNGSLQHGHGVGMGFTQQTLLATIQGRNWYRHPNSGASRMGRRMA